MLPTMNSVSFGVQNATRYLRRSCPGEATARSWRDLQEFAGVVRSKINKWCSLRTYEAKAPCSPAHYHRSTLYTVLLVHQELRVYNSARLIASVHEQILYFNLVICIISAM